MNFEGFKSVESSNTRRGNPNLVKVQAYSDMKYRRFMKKAKEETDGKLEGRFYVANARFKEWGLEGKEGNGLRQFTNGDGTTTVLAVVGKDDAVILKSSKKGNKGKAFKSTRLEAALDKAKAIDATKTEGENQFITLEQVAENVTIDGVTCIKVYKMVAGEAVSAAASAKADNAPTAEASAPAADKVDPAADNVAPPAAAASDWE